MWVTSPKSLVPLVLPIGKEEVNVLCIIVVSREFSSLIGENRQLQMNRLSLRNNELRFETAEKLLIIFEEFIEYTPIY